MVIRGFIKLHSSDPLVLSVGKREKNMEKPSSKLLK